MKILRKYRKKTSRYNGIIKRPFIITLDGGDGCGKSTLADALYNTLKDMGFSVTKVHFPLYDDKSPTSSLLKKFLQTGKIEGHIVSKYTIASLFALERKLWMDTNRPLLMNDDFIIFDRSFLSNLTHNIDLEGAASRAPSYARDNDYLRMTEYLFNICEKILAYDYPYVNSIYDDYSCPSVNFILRHASIEANRVALCNAEKDFDKYEANVDLMERIVPYNTKFLVENAGCFVDHRGNLKKLNIQEIVVSEEVSNVNGPSTTNFRFKDIDKLLDECLYHIANGVSQSPISKCGSNEGGRENEADKLY